MKLLHVIPRFLGGGPERHLLALADRWKQQGLATEHRVVVLDTPVSKPLFLKARKLGLQLFARPSDARLDELIAAADVVDVTLWNHPLLLDALRRPWPAARVVLSTAVSGMQAPQVLFEDLGRFADAVLASGASSERTPALRRAAARGAACRCVPALADMSRLAGFRPRPHDGIRVGYLGLVEPTKLHARFAELCAGARTPGLRFEVFGDGAWAPELEGRFRALGLGGRVRFHGHVEDLNEAFAELDVFGYPLAPDSYATSEKALQEAMWAGIPPVVLAGSAVSDLVEHDRSGLVCGGEADYPLALDRLAADPALRRRLGAGARDAALARFDPTVNARRIRELFEATAAGPRRTRPPLPGAGAPAAVRFVLGLGDFAGPFAVALDGAGRHGPGAVAAAEAAIAASSPVLAHGEGGVVHYRNAFPDDPLLQRWSDLIVRREAADARVDADAGVDTTTAANDRSGT